MTFVCVLQRSPATNLGPQEQADCLLSSHLMGPSSEEPSNWLQGLAPSPLPALPSGLCAAVAQGTSSVPAAGQSCSKPVFRGNQDCFGPETPSWFSQGPNYPLGCDVRGQQWAFLPWKGRGSQWTVLRIYSARGWECRVEASRSVDALYSSILFNWIFKKYKRRKK